MMIGAIRATYFALQYIGFLSDFYRIFEFEFEFIRNPN